MKYDPGRRHTAAIITHDMPRCMSAILAKKYHTFRCKPVKQRCSEAACIQKLIAFCTLHAYRPMKRRTLYTVQQCVLQGVTKNAQRYSLSKNVQSEYFCHTYRDNFIEIMFHLFHLTYLVQLS